MADFPRILRGDVIALDFETSGLKYWDPDFRVLDIAVAAADGAWAWNIKDTPEVIPWLRDLLPGREVAAHSAQFEYQCCRVLGLDPRLTDWYCTMTTACLINEHELTYDLETVCASYGIDSKKSENLRALIEALGVDNVKAALSQLSRAPRELVANYVAGDAVDAFNIRQFQQSVICDQDLHRVVRLERDLLPVLADMSWGGIRVDLAAAHAAIPKLDEEEGILQAEINEITGTKFNVNSTPQVRAFFQPEPINRFQWKLLDGTLVGPTKTGGGPSLDAHAMREIKHPLAEKILALRQTIKLRDTFIRGHVIGSADMDGYVHTHFHQTRNDADAGTVTGRLSSTDPALQQITKRNPKLAAILRSMFLGDDGEEWLCEDYSQVDFRCGAHLQNDPDVIEAYAADASLDYHQIVSDMTGIPRNAKYSGAPNTKQINLGLSFGAGAGKLAFMMGMPYTIRERREKMQYVPGPEAQAIFDMYHTRLPAVQRFMKKAEMIAKDTGYVRTALGRRLRFPRKRGTHKAAGLLYQAYAADLHKVGLINVDRAIRTQHISARLMMSCHDEIGVSMKRDIEVSDYLRVAYTDFNRPESEIQMAVPITASAKFGANWYEASKD